jgi:cytoskeletal protein CcmA (bactofilin family)
VRRALLAFAVIAAALLASAPPASAQERDENDVVILIGPATVAEGETVETVVVFDGSVRMDGTSDDVVMFNGPVTITGTVRGNVVSFNGRVTVRSGATVTGDVVSRSAPTIEEGATVRGDVRRGPGELFREPFPFFGYLAAWLAVSVSVLVLGLIFILLAPRAADALDAVGRTAPGPVIGWGLLLAIGLPLVAVLLLVTLVGIPFGVGLLLALALIYSFGYTMAVWLVGRRILAPPRSRLAAFLVGWVILRLLALIPIVGGLIGTVAVVIGLGAIAVAVWRARRASPAPTAALS